MSRRGIANYAREAQQPVCQDNVHKECVYKEFVTHKFNDVKIESWGQKRSGPEASKEHYKTASQLHFAPPQAYILKKKVKL